MKLLNIMFMLIILFIVQANCLGAKKPEMGLRKGDTPLTFGYGCGIDMFMGGSIRTEEDKIAKGAYRPEYLNNYVFLELNHLISKKVGFTLGYKMIWKTKGAPTDDYEASVSFSDGDGSGSYEKVINEQLLLRYNRVYLGGIYYNEIVRGLYLPLACKIGYNHMGELRPGPHIGTDPNIYYIDNGKPNLSVEPSLGLLVASRVFMIGVNVNISYSIIYFKESPYSNGDRKQTVQDGHIEGYLGTVF